MEDNIDFDARPAIYESGSIPRLTQELLVELIEIANGKLSKAEALGMVETAIARVCNYV